jgi:hypothetical protein
VSSKTKRRAALALAAAAVLVSAGSAQAAESEKVYAVTETGNMLLSFQSDAPGTVNTIGPIGVPGGETVLGIDAQPATGRLFAITSASKVYTVDKATGGATQVGTTAFTPNLLGTAHGVDFNPVPNAIRVVSDAEQNLRLSPVTGLHLPGGAGPGGGDANLNGGGVDSVVGAAYTNSVNGANSTTLYVVDSGDDMLKRQGGRGGTPSPNAGALTAIGALGVNTNTFVGFDISGATNTAYAALQATPGTSTFHTVDLSTGAATTGAQIGAASTSIRGIAVDAQPPSVQLATGGTFAVSESAGNATVTVIRTGNTDGTSNATVSTGTTGTATAGADYTAVTAAPVSFGPGETSKTVSIPVADDGDVEGSETVAVSLALAAMAPGASLGAPNAGTVTVFDDDKPAPPAGQPPAQQPPAQTPPTRDGTAPFALVAVDTLSLARLARGVSVPLLCTERCTVRVSLRLGSANLGSATKRVSRLGTLRLRLTAAGARRLAHRLARARTVQVTLAGSATDAAGNRRTIRQRIAVVR